MSDFQPLNITKVTHTVQLSDVRAAEIMSKGDVEQTLAMLLTNGIHAASVSALQMRCMLSLRRGAFDEGTALLEQLKKVRPDALYHKMAGDLAYLKCEYDKAYQCYDTSLKLNPGNAEVIHDRGVASASGGDIEKGLIDFRKAVDVLPMRPDFHHHLGIMALLGGHEDEGWREMKWRLQVPGIAGTYPHPERYWNGEDLSGKTLVVRTEQGWGDTIMFARYFPTLASRAAKVYIYCQRAMLEWVRHYFPMVEAWPNDAPPPLDFDYQVAIMCLPRLFPKGEFFAPPERNTRGDGIGICWFGSPTHKADHLRTVPIERFGPLAQTYGRNLSCLGYGRFDNKPDFVDYIIDRCHNWLDTAKIVEKLDLIITVDTAIAHLGGFLGIETWLLLPKVCDFRWTLQGDRSPWYPSMRLYRQPKLFDWDSVFAKVNEDLAKRYGSSAMLRAAAA